MIMVSDEILAMRAMDEQNAELRERNQRRVEEAKLLMGKRWVLHPTNSPKRRKQHSVLK